MPALPRIDRLHLKARRLVARSWAVCSGEQA